MKVLRSIIISVLLAIVASQAFAFSNQDKFVCDLAQVCPAESSSLD